MSRRSEDGEVTLTQEAEHASPAPVTPVVGQRGSEHLVVSSSARCPDTVSG